jgi:hypothetical protein
VVLTTLERCPNGASWPVLPARRPPDLSFFDLSDSFSGQLAEQEFVESLLLSTAKLLTPSFFAVIVKESY